MESAQIGRRSVLRKAGVALGGAALATAAVASPAFAGTDSRDDSPTLTGGWLSDRQDVGSDFKNRGVFVFAAGGAMHYQDIFPVNIVLHGAWVGSDRRFRYEMWGGIPEDPASGAPAFTVRVSGPVTVSRRSFTNPYIVAFFDPVSGSELFRLDGVAKATRIDP